MIRASFLFLAMAGLALPLVHAQTAPPGAAKLQFTAVMSRHGVRTPTQPNEALNEYSVQEWPKWNVPLGALSEHGRTLMKLMGAYNREYYSKNGLIGSGGCGEADHFYFYADVYTSTRDIETGEWIADGMFPDCNAKVYSAPPGTSDPFFAPMATAIKPNPEMWAAAMLGRVGGHPERLDAMYRSGLEDLEEVLAGCRPGPNCKAPKRSLLDMHSTITAAPGKVAVLNGPMNLASMLVESLMMEYEDGMPANDVGWGRASQEKLRNLMFLQDAYIDMIQRTPYIARAQSSSLMNLMLRSMEQSVTGRAVAGSLGKAGDRGLILLGHDSQMSYLAGLLRLSWALEGYHPNARPAGSALVFEVWKEASGKNTVRLYISSQTPDQMRNATPLSLANPPLKAPIFIPGCSTAAEGWPCEWDAFKRTVEAAIDPAFLTSAPSKLVVNTLH